MLLAALSCAIVALPFFAVTFPPIADLAQHVDQVRLLFTALAEPGSPYAVHWGTPYALVYALFAALWPWLDPVAVGRVGMLVVALAWVGAVHALAARFERSAAAAVLASVLVFNHTLYWGFASFLFGWPLFVLWFVLTRRPGLAPGSGRRRLLGEAAFFLAGAALLYAAHALWLAVGLVWLAVEGITFRRSRRDLALRLAAVLPVVAAAALWYRGIAATSFSTPPLWLAPLTRLDPRRLVEATFGGLRGGLETAGFVTLLAWLLAAVWGHRRRQGEGGDRGLALLGAMLLVFALLLPDKFTNTIAFHSRWMPEAMAVLLLAAPPLRLPRGAPAAIALAVLLGYSLVTTSVWRRFERVELSGLPEALAALPEGPGLLGLDYRRESRLLDHQPFLQTFAWGQALRGGELNFSFADFAPSLVVFDPPRRTPWTGGLEWYPQLLRTSDLTWFDHVLVNAEPPLHQALAAKPQLAPLTRDGYWRLYRVARPAASAPPQR